MNHHPGDDLGASLDQGEPLVRASPDNGCTASRGECVLKVSPCCPNTPVTMGPGASAGASGDTPSDRRQSETESPGPRVADHLEPLATDKRAARSSRKAARGPGKTPRQGTSQYRGKSMCTWALGFLLRGDLLAMSLHHNWMPLMPADLGQATF
jgi:hypothetical protein